MQLPISIDNSSTSTLQSQIVEQMRALIEQGRLAPGAPVPTTRELGKQMGVSRNTITSAYETLIGQGYLYTERAVGTFVCKTLPDAFMRPQGTGLPARTGSPYRALNLPLPYTGRGPPGLHRPTPGGITVDFVFGRSSARSFPEKAWRRILTDCLGGASERMSEYSHPGGIAELRQLITSHLGPARGMVVSAEQVLLVAGFQQGINLAGHLFVGTNTPVVMEAPTYRGAAFLFESYGSRIIAVPVDQHGIDVGRLPAARVKLVYVTPSHQFPTGVTMPLHRRLALLEWAAKAGAYILEVDYDADFRYEGSPLPSLQSLDRNGCVIYLNSFSRSIGPGLRIGYMVVPRDLIRPALTIKSLMDNGLPWLEQAALAQFMREGSWETHVKKLRHTYELRRNALLEALRAELPGAAVSGAEAGTHVYLTLPAGAPRAALVQQACRALGVGVYPLADSPAWLYEHLADHERGLLMGYTHLSEAQIRRGIAVLGTALAA
ncbi:PLP-dependent aminotransferase family protein [Methylibium sp.]|uniref:MocR-like pyridoxine biosynthesis transcription factor PdxR n=1 Tax=Methylibium sp. TaxID=2067992 RepID=UPI0017BA38DC|nr:PLP-dependent aminotransferase family protein [Methylibium sp.]MBA3588244.1 PLP-dependent aminotransferase family protein [Methylibium sp.]